MKCLRTPDHCFENLPGYSFEPNYQLVPDTEGGELRVHYLDEGPRDGPVVLCMHGQPSWSYLYRKMIPLFTARGYRTIAPDLVGFGRSDKPSERENYTYANHVSWITALVSALDLQEITLVCQDWGGLIGLRVATENSERFARILVANTGLPDANGVPDDQIEAISASMGAYYDSLPVAADAPAMGAAMAADTSGMGFLHWVKFCSESDGFAPSDVLAMSTAGALSDAEVAAYAAPYPDASYLAGARQFPSLVPVRPDNPAIPANRAAWKVLEQWTKPLLTAFSDSDPITAGGDVRFRETVPGAKDQPHTTLKGAGHFLQEQVPGQLVNVVVKLMGRS
ncbi:MAG: haloalkane dehalogenase [Pseudomonadales bacterium]